MEIYDVNLSYEFHNLGAQELILYVISYLSTSFSLLFLDLLMKNGIL